ncbi:MAG: aconitate hydratase [Kiritimatiellae bacterium]|nr:aconitate hydratase [Kiritimatiellia bacterium]MBQ3341063.1 aconitate hydratase [Kiritimatiellia bacterium]
MSSEARNVVQKILAAHLVEGDPSADAEIGIRIDQTLTQDATGTMAYLQFESMGVSRVKTEVSVSYVDHNTVQIGFENADDHDFLQSVAKKYGVVYSKCGNGICHQLHLERFGRPGSTLLGSDSHTPTGGGIGQIAIGAGGIDIAVAMAGGAFHIPSPKVRAIVLKGRLRRGVSAKDVILAVLRRFGTKGNVGWMFEYTGPGVRTLDVPSRATIANMGAELGVTTSVFPSDAVTRQFLAAQGRAKDFVEIVPDRGAKYDDVFEVDLSKVEPLMAAPHSPGNVVAVRSMKGRRVNQIMIGSCTNSSYRDIRTVALYLKGRHVADDVEVGIACGSRQVVNMLAKDGSLGILHAAGCRMLENACGFCIGAHMSPRTGAVSLRTNNRNFEGRSGTKSAQVYLVSPETAAASALTGRVELPTERPVAAVPAPKKFPVDDSMFLYRATAGRGVRGAKIVRGPNIAPVPRGVPLPADLKAVCAIKVGDKITTDHIMPAGARLKFRSNIPAYAKFVFEPCDPGFHDRCLANKEKGLANVIVAGESYGQGSSREHAALCPMYLGVRAVFAKSIERIHRANLVNFGIVPFTFEDPAGYDLIAAGDAFDLDGIRAAVEGDGRLVVKTAKGSVPLRTSLSDRERHIILCGGLLASL